MPDTNPTAALRVTLQYLMTSDIPSIHKTVLIGLLTKALHEDNSLSRAPVLQAEAPWQEQEMQLLTAFLSGKVANSWQHADELLMDISTRLHRQPQNVRSKASDLGFGAGVDYRLARALARERERHNDEIQQHESR